MFDFRSSFIVNSAKSRRSGRDSGNSSKSGISQSEFWDLLFVLVDKSRLLPGGEKPNGEPDKPLQHGLQPLAAGLWVSDPVLCIALLDTCLAPQAWFLKRSGLSQGKTMERSCGR